MPDVGHTDYTPAQLHHQACIVCGRTDGALLPDGHVQVVYTETSTLSWAVAACPEHQGATR